VVEEHLRPEQDQITWNEVKEERLELGWYREQVKACV
jgi:hypothetical protein